MGRSDCKSNASAGASAPSEISCANFVITRSRNSESERLRCRLTAQLGRVDAYVSCCPFGVAHPRGHAHFASERSSRVRPHPHSQTEKRHRWTAAAACILRTKSSPATTPLNAVHLPNADRLVVKLGRPHPWRRARPRAGGLSRRQDDVWSSAVWSQQYQSGSGELGGAVILYPDFSAAHE